MPRIAFGSLRARLILLVLLAVLPTVGLTLYTAEQDRSHAASDAEATALRLARVAAQDQLLLIESGRQFLLAIAHLPDVLSDDLEACNAQMAELLAEFPRYSNAGAIRPDGELYCSALPFTPPWISRTGGTFRERCLPMASRSGTIR